MPRPVLVLYCALGAALLGYSAQLQAGGDDIFDMTLDQLLEIRVVSASATPQSLRDVPATIRVITAEQIAARGYRDLDDALRDLPGIDLVHVQGAYPTIRAFRGSYGDENRRLLLMIDGIVENSLNGSFEMGGPAYGLLGIERIEVIWGPASALYGANAYSGIVNLITRKPQATAAALVQAGGGSYDSRWQQIWLSAGSDTQSFSLSASRYRSDGARYTELDPEFDDAYVDDAQALLARWRFQQESGTTLLGLQMFDTPAGDGVFGNSPTQFLQLPRSEPRNAGESGFLHSSLGGDKASLWEPYSRTLFAEQTQEFNAAQDARLRLWHRQTGLRDSYSFSFDGSGFTQFHGRHDSWRDGLDAQFNQRYSAQQTLHLGLQYFRDDLESGYRPTTIDDELHYIDGYGVKNIHAEYLPRVATVQRNLGAYAEYVQHADWLGASVLTLGARHDRNSQYGAVTNPRIGWVLKGWHPLDIKLLYGTAYRAPTTYELYGHSPVRAENPDLRAERMRTTELVLGYEAVDQLWQLSAYHSYLYDVIADGSPLPDGRFQVRNVGEMSLNGIEAGVECRPATGWQIFANLSRQWARQRTENSAAIDVPNVAAWKANVGLHYSHADWGSIDLIGNYLGKRSTAASNPYPQLPSHQAWQFSARSAPLWQHFHLGGLIANALDADYDDPGIKQADGKRFAPLLPQPGRSYWLTLEFRQ